MGRPGPFTDAYNNSCAMIGGVLGPFPPATALASCQHLCSNTAGCTAMNYGTGYGLPHVGMVDGRFRYLLSPPSVQVLTRSGHSQLLQVLISSRLSTFCTVTSGYAAGSPICR